MNGLLDAFLLKDFNMFFNNYKLTNILASEALLALEHFIPVLNEFFDLCDDLTEEMVRDAKVSWYSYTNITPSGDYIKAKSMHYNELSFSDVSINMRCYYSIVNHCINYQIKIKYLAKTSAIICIIVIEFLLTLFYISRFLC